MSGTGDLTPMTPPAATTSKAEGTPTPVTPDTAGLIQRIKDLVASDATNCSSHDDSR